MTQHHELKDILEEQDQQMEIVSRQLDGLYEQTQEHIDRADQQSRFRGMNLDMSSNYRTGITEILDWVMNIGLQIGTNYCKDCQEPQITLFKAK